MKRPASALLVIPFIAKYDIDVDDFAKSAFDYKSFNEFFCRALKPQARPIAQGARVAVFPADGRHLAIPDVDAAEGFYIKGMKFAVADLMGEGSGRFAGGAMLLSRLCPVDYHRFHFPVDSVPCESRLFPGWLYSVSPVALRRNLRYLVANKRCLTLVESPVFGAVAMIEIGATNVGSIRQSFLPDRAASKGAEKGFFSFGGSCVVTLFERGRIVFDADIVAQSRQCIETFARMGDRLGEAP
jgi:phosphatidylserine decarboxylase